MSDIHDIQRIGWDPGFSATKLAQVVQEEVVTYCLPATVGVVTRDRKEGLSLGGVVRPQRAGRRPFSVGFEGQEFLVGPNVADFTEPVDRLDFDRFTDSPELRAAFYAGISRLVNGGPRRVALAVALPVEVVQDKAEAQRVEEGLRKWLLGEHRFSVDGVDTSLTVAALRARIPQPVATWFDWGLNRAGEWVLGPEAQKSPVLIIDQGFNTLDVLVIEQGRISERVSDGDTLGMRRAAERLIRAIKHQHRVELELSRADELIRQAVNGQAATTYVNGQATDVTAEARQSLRSLEADVYNFLDRAIGKNAGAYRILLTGGGALALAGMLQRRFPQASLMAEPVLANARGLAKLANRPGFLG